MKKNQGKSLEVILLMIRVHRAREIFNVKTIGTNKAFDVIKSVQKDDPYKVALSTCDVGRHVVVVKRMIRFIKERIRVVRLDILTRIASYGSAMQYSNASLKSTPQYGFTCGMKEFGDMGYEATRKELNDNIIGMIELCVSHRKEHWCVDRP